MNTLRFLVWGAVFAVSGVSLRGEFLYQPANPTPNGFVTPSWNFGGMVYEYSAWDIFYSPHTQPNYPDVFAPYGGVETSPGVWVPVQRSTVPGFPSAPGIYNPADPLAFWDTRNATITQTGGTGTFIIGADVSGNIYSFSQVNQFVLENSPDYGSSGLGSVVLQFQTDGITADFSSIRLVYDDGFGGEISISALDAEYLREYRSTGGGHWSAAGGYSNRLAIQWDLSGIRDGNDNPISSYKIYWDASATSMSFQKADLATSDTYEAGIPISAAWVGGNGSWNSETHWRLKENSGFNLPRPNGNIKFKNNSPAVVSLPESFALGELIFESAENVTISTANNSPLASNTGIATRESATGVYTIDTGFVLGALNFFDIQAGTVVMNGSVSGNHGIVKSGAGTLVLANNNSFTGFLGIQGGTARISGTNTYSGTTTVVNGRLVVAANAGGTGALGSSTSTVTVGADESLFHYVAGGQDWIGELLIEGDHVINRDIILAPGDFKKRLGAFNTSAGATYSGNISLTGNPGDPNTSTSVAGQAFFTAQGNTDRLLLSGAITGGSTSKTVTLDGPGTVVFSGASKTYSNSTIVQQGTLLIAADSGYTGQGNITVGSGTRVVVNGFLSGAGSLAINGGTIGGEGKIERAITIDEGDALSPGSGIGKLETINEQWAASGRLQLEIADLNAGAGLGWDFVEIIGALEILASVNNRFIIEINSRTIEGSSGLVAGFDPGEAYSWKFLGATGGFAGFDANAFAFDTSGFQNAPGGVFTVSQNGTDLYLNYLTIPEPCSLMILIGSAPLWLRRRRRSLS